jgi:hypothetical protein
VAALVAAVRAKSAPEILAVVGPSSGEWIFSGDKVADTATGANSSRPTTRRAASRRRATRPVLVVGDDAWPFPAPIVKKGNQWAFDANAGREEVINRRVGRNELDTDAGPARRGRCAARIRRQGCGRQRLRRLRKALPLVAGKKDGLYWPTEGNAPQSPLGPLVAVASREGYGKEGPPKDGKPQPYHGYYYKIITAQGKDAPAARTTTW